MTRQPFGNFLSEIHISNGSKQSKHVLCSVWTPITIVWLWIEQPKGAILRHKLLQISATHFVPFVLAAILEAFSRSSHIQSKFPPFWSGLSSVSLDTPLLPYLYMRKRHYRVPYKTFTTKNVSSQRPRLIWRYDLLSILYKSTCLSIVPLSSPRYYLLITLNFLCLSLSLNVYTFFSHYLVIEGLLRKQFVARKQLDVWAT